MITPQIRVPLSELEFSYVRSSGPGGQNVNKVNSKAVLRWNFLASRGLSEELKARLQGKLATRMTSEGELLVSSDSHRDQLRNREDCLEKLRRLVADAAFVPKARKKTRPSRGSVRRKREAKTRQSEKKSMRRRHHDD